MHIDICKQCSRFREIEKQCVCKKARKEIYSFWKDKIIFAKEGILCLSTFFKKEMPEGCKYAVGKKKYERGKREYNKCKNCEQFEISEPRYKCTFSKIVYLENKYIKESPVEKCDFKLEHIICMEAQKNENYRN